MATIKLCGGTVVTPTPDCPELKGTCDEPCETDCGCGPVAAPCPQPFYDEAPSVQQSNCEPTVLPKFYTTLKSLVAWNIPACGETAIVKFGCLGSILTGSQIWNGVFGYFEVTNFNADTGEITVKNNCVDGNAAPGTTVPKCSEFIIAPPVCCVGGSNENPLLFPYVAIDFTAQAVGACQLITVTSVNGLAVGKNVQIGSGTYRVSSINSATTITICNDGAGIAFGTSVIARTPSGDYQYPIILIDTNPCTNATVTSGSMLVCDSGVVQPATGLAVGSVWVLTNATTGEGEYQITGNPTFTCAILTESLTLTTGVAIYTVTVNNAFLFAIPDVLQIGTRSDRATVTGVPDGTHVNITLSPTPSSIQLIPAGTSICLISCCEALETRIDATDAALSSEITLRNFQHQQVSSFQQTEVATNATADLTDGQTLTSNNATIGVSNTAIGAVNPLRVTICIDCAMEGTLTMGGDGLPILINFRLSLQKNGGGFIVQGTHATMSTNIPVSSHFDHIGVAITDSIAPGDIDTWVVQAKVSLANPLSGADYLIVKFQPRISIMGISV